MHRKEIPVVVPAKQLVTSLIWSPAERLVALQAAQIDMIVWSSFAGRPIQVRRLAKASWQTISRFFGPNMRSFYLRQFVM